jgi:hypothetical protein
MDELPVVGAKLQFVALISFSYFEGDEIPIFGISYFLFSKYIRIIIRFGRFPPQSVSI